MGVYPPKASSPQSPGIDQMHHVCIGGTTCLGKRFQIGQERYSVFQIPASEFAEDKWVHQHQAILQQFSQISLSVAKMGDPD